MKTKQAVTVISIMFEIIVGLAAQLWFTTSQLHQREKNDAQLEEQSLRFVHNVQTNNFAREGAPETTVATNGGAQ